MTDYGNDKIPQQREKQSKSQEKEKKIEDMFRYAKYTYPRCGS